MAGKSAFAGRSRECVALTRRAVLAVAFASYGCKSAHTGRDPREAISAAHDFIKARLISPGTATFGGEADTQVDEIAPDRFRVKGIVDYSSGDATTRVPFTCVVSVGVNGQWSLDEMDFQ